MLAKDATPVGVARAGRGIQGVVKRGPERPHKQKDPYMVYIYICTYVW